MIQNSIFISLNFWASKQQQFCNLELFHAVFRENFRILLVLLHNLGFDQAWASLRKLSSFASDLHLLPSYQHVMYTMHCISYMYYHCTYGNTSLMHNTWRFHCTTLSWDLAWRLKSQTKIHKIFNECYETMANLRWMECGLDMYTIHATVHNFACSSSGVQFTIDLYPQVQIIMLNDIYTKWGPHLCNYHPFHLRHWLSLEEQIILRQIPESFIAEWFVFQVSAFNPYDSMNSEMTPQV